MRRKLAIAAAVTAIVLGVLVTRAVWQGRAALRDGDAAAARGDLAAAIDHWQRAARWYVPLAPHVDDAYHRLEATATDQGRLGNLEISLQAWRAIRSSVLATRWLVTPQAKRYDRATRYLTLVTRTELPDDAASVPWMLFALAGSGLWIGGCAYFARRGLDPEDRLVRKAASAGGGMVLIGLIAWVIGLYNA